MDFGPVAELGFELEQQVFGAVLCNTRKTNSPYYPLDRFMALEGKGMTTDYRKIDTITLLECITAAGL